MRTDIRPQGRPADSFFGGPTIDVARRLIGAMLYRRIPRGQPDAGALLAGRIVESEAYLPLVDPSCHGYRGPTKRTATLFGRPGFAYVYLIYGMYFCLNVTTEPPGIGAAVLIRALEPVLGIAAMRRRRGAQVTLEALACGPGNLCRAFAIDRTCDGLDLRTGDLRIEPDATVEEGRIGVSGRVGLNVAQKWPLRFFDRQSPCTSPFRKGQRRGSVTGSPSR